MDPLLEPISADFPCGEDLSYDAVYNDLGVLIQGTPENQFETGSAKEPDWNEMRKQSEAALGRSKDLQIGVYFAVALVQTKGMEGAARGLELLAGIVRQYWDTLFPQLDPDDKDPTQRVNILSQLTVEQGSFGDPVKFIERLSAAPIFRVPGLAVTLNFLSQEVGPGAGIGATKLPEIMAGGDPETVNAGIDTLRRAVAAVHGLDDYLIETLGRSAAPSFEPLIKVLDKGLRYFDSLQPAAATANAAANPAAGGSVPAAAGTVAYAPQASAPGEIRSLDDVRNVLIKIREYYAVHEPASPVPLLLQRAERLIGKNFLDLLANVAPNSRAEFDVLVGPET